MSTTNSPQTGLPGGFLGHIGVVCWPCGLGTATFTKMAGAHPPAPVCQLWAGLGLGSWGGLNGSLAPLCIL